MESIVRQLASATLRLQIRVAIGACREYTIQYICTPTLSRLSVLAFLPVRKLKFPFPGRNQNRRSPSPNSTCVSRVIYQFLAIQDASSNTSLFSRGKDEPRE
jgi:hypothetical protein